MQTLRRQAAVVDHLKSIDQFTGYNKAQLREVARLTEHVKVGEGKTLVREGQFGKELFLILFGTVEVTQKGRLVNALGPGDFFGELSALNRRPRSATVTALSEVDLLIVGPRESNMILQEFPISGMRCWREWRAGCKPSTRSLRRHSIPSVPWRVAELAAPIRRFGITGTLTRSALDRWTDASARRPMFRLHR